MFRNESEFVRWLRGHASGERGRIRLGIGDDAALVGVGAGDDLILTTDMSIEGVHFRRDLHPPCSVGHRALARSLSDIAAMGGKARFALISLAISRRTTRAWMEEFYAGLGSLANHFDVQVIGGDTAVVSGATMVDVIVAGEVPRGRALRRSGARPGDQIFVSGRLGLSALGLELIRSRRPDIRKPRSLGGEKSPWRARAIEAHLFPQPPCALGRFLAVRRLASALIDVSDGLSTDLGNLCESSRVGARLWESLIPGPEIPASQAAPGRDVLGLALHGGEDYQLLFTVPPHKSARVPGRFRGVPLHRIGEIRDSKELLLVRADRKQERLLAGGYDHFRTAFR